MLLGAAFLPAPLGFLAWGALVPLLVALQRRLERGAGLASLFRLGYAYGFVFFLIGIHWIALLSDVAITVPWLKFPACLLAAAYLALFGGLTTALAGWMARRSSLGLAFPLALVAIEELRGSGELGLPWFQPGYTQHAYVPVLQMAGLGGVTLVTLWVAVLNVLLWRALTLGPRLRSALGFALLLALPWAWGHQALKAAPRGQGPVVSLIQGNIPGEIKWSGRHQQQILATFLALSDSAVAGAPRPTLLIWPETATGSYLRKQLDQALAVASFTARTGVPIFTGFADYTVAPDGSLRNTNAAGLFLPDGRQPEPYAKRHLVPFGERMPFQKVFPALGRLDLGQAEWTPGRGPVLFPSPAGPFGCLVCFESIFPDLARDDVRRGAKWLVNVTNDEWFGNSAALYQHAAMAVFRAAENHVPLARCANTGLTILVDAQGRVVRRVPTFTPAILSAPLPEPAAPTLFTRVGDWPGWLSLAGLLLIALGAGRALTARARAE